MRFRCFLLIVSGTFLAGCSHLPFHSKSHSYLQESGSIPELQSTPNAQIKTGPNYFPLPPIGDMQVARQTPSLVPPGSDLQRFKKQAAPIQAAPKTKAVLQSQNGTNILSANESSVQAWNDVPKTLAQTPYHILDQDQSMGTYYVLDTTQSNGQITQATPIYRLSLMPASSSTTAIQLTARDGAALPENVSQRILSALAQNWVA